MRRISQISIHTKKRSVPLERLISLVKRNKRVGVIITFSGIVRGFSDGKRVKKLLFDSHPSLARKSLCEIRECAKRRYGIIDIAIHHTIDELSVGENILQIVISAEHRKEAFSALKYIIERIKKETPIWKKEVRNNGEAWVSG